MFWIDWSLLFLYFFFFFGCLNWKKSHKFVKILIFERIARCPCVQRAALEGSTPSARWRDHLTQTPGHVTALPSSPFCSVGDSEATLFLWLTNKTKQFLCSEDKERRVSFLSVSMVSFYARPRAQRSLINRGGASNVLLLLFVSETRVGTTGC